MSIPLTKSCHKMGCELHASCALYKAEKAQMQIIPQHCGWRCDFYTPIQGSTHKQVEVGEYDMQERIMRMAGCLQ